MPLHELFFSSLALSCDYLVSQAMSCGQYSLPAALHMLPLVMMAGVWKLMQVSYVDPSIGRSQANCTRIIKLYKYLYKPCKTPCKGIEQTLHRLIQWYLIKFMQCDWLSYFITAFLRSLKEILLVSEPFNPVVNSNLP